MTIRWWTTRGSRGLGAGQRGVFGFPKLPFSDARLLLGVAAVALITLAKLSNPEPLRRLAPTRVVPGQLGAKIMSFALSPATAQIATTNDVGRITLRSPESGWQIERVLDFAGFATEVAFSPDGRSLAAAGIVPGIFLWDLRSARNEPSTTMMVPIQRVNCIMFAPDGQSLAVTSRLDGTILLWDVATQRARMVLHQFRPVVSIAFSPDGRWLATGSRDNQSIVLWDLQSGSGQELLEDEPGVTKARRLLSRWGFAGLRWLP